MESNVTLVQQYPAHEAIPEAPHPLPAVILFHDVYGLTPEIRGATNRLAREGFCVAAPDFYAHPFSVSPGAPAWMADAMTAAAEPGWEGYPARAFFRHDEGDQARNVAAGIDAARARDVVVHALGWAERAPEADPARIGLVGFGFGARLAFRSACAFPARVAALVGFSPAALAAPFDLRPDETMPILEFESLNAPCLLFFGEQDPGVARDERAALERTLTSAGRPHDIVAFRGAGREFFDPDSPDFRVGPARQAWEATLAFLRRALVGGPSRAE